MKILLHICCAPCSVMSIKVMREQRHELTGYWYNPNIHPVTEYKARLHALREYAKSVDLELIENDEYGLEMFTKNVISDLSNRCDFCYEVRIRKVAIEAREKGFDAFSTTLLISPYQLHDKLVQTCERISKEEKIAFHYVDLRPYFREGQKIAREFPLYMQKYCGCIFSEEERYLKKVRIERT
ncbi:MAG: epoxyqueuosine reductase QueH [Firmicutes bacterium]|nr:epoxyqueuosine reductase QueH [Bacillota bacterium]